MRLIQNLPKIPVAEDTIIWRYLKIDKYYDLISNNRLFFCRIDLFEDPFEGSIPKREVDYRPIESIKISHFNNNPITLDEAKIRDTAMAETHRLYRQTYIVSCWHMNQHESEAMWKLYLSENKGVAIKSTVGQLLSSLSDNNNDFIDSRVRYIDYENDIWYDKNEYPIKTYNMFSPFIHKRKSLQHENEFRLLHNVDEAFGDSKYWEKQDFCKGRYFRVKLDILISDIIVSPFISNDSFNEIVAYSLNKSELPIPKKSALLNPPHF